MSRHALLIASALAMTSSPGVDAAERPNILFIFADDLGYGDLASHGHPHVRTPNLDRLAREGVDFRQFLVASGVCSPSRVAVMTGQYPARLNVHGHFARFDQNAVRGMPNHLPLDAPFVPRLLKDAGYATGHFGKWHLSGSPHDRQPNPRRYGIDRARVWTGPSPNAFAGVAPKLRPDERLTGAALAWDTANKLSPAATNHAVRFVRANAERPWFVNLWLHETHHVVSATEEERAEYPNVPEPQKTYLASVSRADRCVGEMLDLLDELGLADDTLVVFSSDNGPENSQPNPDDKLYYSVGQTGGRRGQKRSLYLGGINVPFLARWPSTLPAGLRDESTVIGGVDLFPTFLAAAGFSDEEIPDSDGENALPALRGEDWTRSQPLFWQWNAARPTSPKDWPTLGVRDGRYTLVAATDDDDRSKVVRSELYDAVADPGQTNDLSQSQPEVASRLIEAALAWERTLPESPRATVADAPSRRRPNRASEKSKSD